LRQDPVKLFRLRGDYRALKDIAPKLTTLASSMFHCS
jgi:hypothetical protein